MLTIAIAVGLFLVALFPTPEERATWRASRQAKKARKASRGSLQPVARSGAIRY